MNNEEHFDLINLSHVDTGIEEYRLMDWGNPHRSLPKTFCPHIVAVTVVQDHKLTQINGSGIHERTIEQGGRSGSEVCITYVGEDNAMHYEVRAFCKGEVLCQFTSIADDAEDSNEEPTHMRCGELWRK